MAIYQVPTPVETHATRIPCEGPAPCNTLAFVRCVGGVVDTAPVGGSLARETFRFLTKFKIDGFVQSKFDWYRENTLVSATARLREIGADDDVSFVLAVDSVAPFLEMDGTLGFECIIAGQTDGEVIWGGYDVSAYVLLFEPRVERPPGGLFGRRLGLANQVKQIVKWRTVARAGAAGARIREPKCGEE